MGKVTKILFFIAIILVIVYMCLTGYINNLEDISTQVGSKIGTSEITTADYYTLANCIETYKSHIENKEYQAAYLMLNPVYRNYKKFDEYKKIIDSKSFADLKVIDINPVTMSLYNILCDNNGVEEAYSVLVNLDERTFSILPDSFLDYKKIKQKQSKKNLECKLEDYVVNTDKCLFNFEFINNSNNEITINSGCLYTTYGDKIGLDEVVSIAPKESKKVQIVFDTNFMFPKKIELARADLENYKYVFEFKK